MKNLLLALLLFPVTFYAQVAMNGSGSYTQNFDALLNTGSVNSWVENSTIPNWYSQRTTASTSYAASTGSSTTGGLYSFGASGANDRALGAISSSNTSFGGNFAHGLLFQNTGSSVVIGISITYTLEQWRNGGSNAAQNINFWYKISATSITGLNPGDTAGWTPFTDLDGSSLQSSETAGALDGNATANREIISGVLPASIPPGSYLMVKWEDPNHPLDDDGFGLDDFSANWSTCSPTSGTDVQTACDSITWIDGNTYTSSNNEATFNLLNSSGCDSLVTLDLTLNLSSIGFELVEACAFPYTDSNSGITYNAPDTIVDVSVGSNGCPVTYTTYVNLVPNTFVTTINPDPDLPILFSDTFIIEGFQWYDCNSSQILPDENSDTLFLTTNGNYALIGYWPYNCIDTSNCINVNWIGAGLEEPTEESFNIVPNPSNGSFELIFKDFHQPVLVEVYDLNGKIILTRSLSVGSYKVNLPELSSGTYLLSAKTDDSVFTTRIIIE